MNDRITIRFRNPKDLRALKNMAEQKKIKLNRLVCNLLSEALEKNEELYTNYLEDLKSMK